MPLPASFDEVVDQFTPEPDPVDLAPTPPPAAPKPTLAKATVRGADLAARGIAHYTTPTTPEMPQEYHDSMGEAMPSADPRDALPRDEYGTPQPVVDEEPLPDWMPAGGGSAQKKVLSAQNGVGAAYVPAPRTALERPGVYEARVTQEALEHERLQRAESAAAKAAQTAGNRETRERLKIMGIPGLEDLDGNVEPVRDATGVPLQHHDQRNNVAWDSQGRAVEIRINPVTFQPEMRPAMASARAHTDKKTGARYKVRAGLPWEYAGEDPAIVEQLAQKERVKLDSEARAVLAPAIAEAKTVFREQRGLYKQSTSDLEARFAEMGVPPVADLSRAKPEDLRAHIEKTFNQEYGAPAANAAPVFGGGKYSTKALAIRADIDQRKAAALQALGAHAEIYGAMSAAEASMIGLLRERADLDRGKLEEVNARRVAAGLQPIGIGKDEGGRMKAEEYGGAVEGAPMGAVAAGVGAGAPTDDPEIPEIIDPGKNAQWNAMQRAAAISAKAAGLPPTTDSRERVLSAIQRAEAAGYAVPHFMGRPDEPEGDRGPTMDVENLVRALREQQADALRAGDDALAEKIGRERAYWENDIALNGMTAEQWKAQTGEDDPVYTEAHSLPNSAPQNEAPSTTNEEPALPKKDFFRADDLFSGIWDAVSGLGTTAPAAFYQLVEGMERPDKYSESAKAAFAAAEARSREMQAKTEANRAAGVSSSVGETFREVGDSLGFSAGTLAAALPAGFVGAKLGAATGGAIGAAVTAPGAGAGAIPGAAIGGTIGGIGATMAASGTAAYRMAGAAFLSEAFDTLEAESMRKNGRPMDEAEKQSAYDALLPIAKNTALWEAGPEAVGNAVTLGAGKIIFGLGKPLAAKFAASLAGKAAAGGAAVGTELATETLTQVEQAGDQRKAAALADGRDPSTESADWSAGGVIEAFKEVAPQTLALLGLMGGAGAVAKGGIELAKRSEVRGQRSDEEATPPESATDFTTPSVVEPGAAGAVDGTTEPLPLPAAGDGGGSARSEEVLSAQNGVEQTLIPGLDDEPTTTSPTLETSPAAPGAPAVAEMQAATGVPDPGAGAESAGAVPDVAALEQELQARREEYARMLKRDPLRPLVKRQMLALEEQLAARDEIDDRRRDHPEGRAEARPVASAPVQGIEQQLSSDVASVPVQPSGGNDVAPAAVAATSEKKLASTQVTLRSEDSRPLVEFAEQIPDADVFEPETTGQPGGHGRETEPHVTALFGLTPDVPKAAVQEAAARANTGPVTITLGKLSVFENDKYDVLKVDVESPQLRALNAELRKLPNENSFPDYQPHLTIAYLKKGMGAKYAGDARFEGKTFTIPELTFSGADRTHSPISLSGAAVTIPGLEPETVESGAKTKGKRFAVRYTGDTFKDDPVVSTIIEHGGLMSKTTAQAKWSAEKWRENKGEWDDAPRLSHPTHNAIYKKGGMQPDDMVGPLVEAGLLPESATVAEMWAAIGRASVGAASLRQQTAAQSKESALREKQGKAFAKDAAKPEKGDKAIATETLQIGDQVTIGTEKMKVIEIDPESYDVTLEDHEKYGVQEVQDGIVIYGRLKKAPGADQSFPAKEEPVAEKMEQAHASPVVDDQFADISEQGRVAARKDAAIGDPGGYRPRNAPKNPYSHTSNFGKAWQRGFDEESPIAWEKKNQSLSTPQLRPGKAADDLLQGENDVFNLVSETAADKAARQKRELAEEKEAAEKASAEAKAAQDKQQAGLFDAESNLDKVPNTGDDDASTPAADEQSTEQQSTVPAARTTSDGEGDAADVPKGIRRPVEAGAEGSERGSGSAGVAGESGVEAGGKSGGVKAHTAEGARRLIRAAEASPAWAAMRARGVVLKERTGDTAPLAVMPDGTGKTVLFNATTLAEWMEIVRGNGADAETWLSAALSEEGFHTLQDVAAGGNLRTKYDALAKAMGQARLTLTGRVYQGQSNLFTLAAEYERMLWQFRTSGTFTEETDGSKLPLAQMRAMLAAEQPAEIEASLAKVIRAGGDKAKDGGVVVPPKFALRNPITGRTGAKIVGYEWRSTMGEKYSQREGGMVEARVSDWDNSDESTGTGRSIVHVYYVEHPGGRVSIEGIQSAQNILGISETKLQSIAKNERAAQRHAEEQEDQEIKNLESIAQDSPNEAARHYRKLNHSPLRTFEENDEYFYKSLLFTKNGKYLRRSPLAAEMLKRHGWDVVADDPVKRVRGIAKETKPSSTKEEKSVIPGIDAPERPKAVASKGAPRVKPDAAGTGDAGAELSYNRRNRVKTGIKWDDIAALNPTLKVKEAQKANVYPKPDYEKLIADGMPVLVAHMVKQSYDSIAAKPSIRGAATDTDLQRYIAGVHRVMDGVMKWAKDAEATGAWAKRILPPAGGRPISIIDEMRQPRADMLASVYEGGDWKPHREELMSIGGNKVLSALQPGRAEAMRATKEISKGWPAKMESWQKQGFKIIPASTLTIRGQEQSRGGETIYFIELPGNRYIKYVDTKAEAEAFVGGLQPFLVMDKHNRIKGQFATQEEAEEGARGLTKRDGKTTISDKGIDVAMARRTGPARRMEGEDVSSDKMRETFGFKGVNFGNWMKGDSNQAERQLHLNHAYDAFMDLAEILGVPHKAMSLNGMLGVAIGAQGSGGTHSAHFVPGVNEINLTRTSGAGALAHEWAHALDHYFATQAGLATSPEPFLTEHASQPAMRDRIVDGKSVKVKTFGDGIRMEIIGRFKGIVEAMNKRPQTPEEAKRATALSREMADSTIGRWIKSIQNDFTAAKVDAEAFDKLAARITSLDLGDGKVAVGNAYISPVVDELRSLYKAKTGRTYSLDQIKGLQGNLDRAVYLKAHETEEKEHVPQMVATNYSREAGKLDTSKSGKRYWSTDLEKFARAFDAFTQDKLADATQRNTYLAGINDGPETSPQGDERKAINRAFQALIDAIETKETESGVMLFAGKPVVIDKTALERLKDKLGVGELTPEEALLVGPMIPKGWRRLFQGAADTLEQTRGLEGLGRAVRKHIDKAREIQGALSVPYRALARSETPAEFTAAEKEVETFYALKDSAGNGSVIGVDGQTGIRNPGLPQVMPEEYERNMSPAGKAHLAAWRGVADRLAAFQAKLGVQVKGSDGKWRAIGKVTDYHPRSVRPDYMNAILDPRGNPGAWREVVAIMKKSGMASTEQEVMSIFAKEFRGESANDFFSNIERARELTLPKALYDYTFKARQRYLMRSSERLAQIDAYGQKTTADTKDAFDLALEATYDHSSQEYIQAVRDRAYGVTPRTFFHRLLAGLNGIATGTQLGNPITVGVNLVSGLSYNATHLGLRNSLGALLEMRNAAAAIDDAHARGVLLDDLLNLTQDAEQLGSNLVSKIHAGTGLALKWTGYNATESFVRAHGLLTAKAYLRQAVAAHAKDSNSKASQIYTAFMKRHGIDAAKVYAEQSGTSEAGTPQLKDGPETNRFYRAVINAPQGGYRIDQVPPYIDSPIGKFLFKYQKWGAQQTRFFMQNVIDPALGRGGPRDVRPLARYLVLTAVTGLGLAALKEWLFGSPDRTASLEEIGRTWDDDEVRALALTAQKLWIAQMNAGAYGMLGNYSQSALDVADRSKFKNPLSPPGLASVTNAGEMILRAIEQKTLTGADADDFLRAQLSLYRTTKAAGARALGVAGPEAPLANERARQDNSWLGTITRRFANEVGVEASRTSLGRIGKTENSPTKTALLDALRTGDVAGAKAAAEKLTAGKDHAGRKAALESLKATVRAAQPIKVGAAGEARRVLFLKWATDRLPVGDLERIRRIDATYRDTARKAGLFDPAPVSPKTMARTEAKLGIAGKRPAWATPFSY